MEVTGQLQDPATSPLGKRLRTRKLEEPQSQFGRLGDEKHGTLDSCTDCTVTPPFCESTENKYS